MEGKKRERERERQNEKNNIKFLIRQAVLDTIGR